MISRKTTFVLGAGAGFPYGYPSRPGLKEFILDDHSKRLIEMIFTDRYDVTKDFTKYINTMIVPKWQINILSSMVKTKRMWLGIPIQKSKRTGKSMGIMLSLVMIMNN